MTVGFTCRGASCNLGVLEERKELGLCFRYRSHTPRWAPPSVRMLELLNVIRRLLCQHLPFQQTKMLESDFSYLKLRNKKKEFSTVGAKKRYSAN